MDSGSPRGIAEETREEYRKFLRFPLSLQAECRYKAGGTAERCRIVDISGQGLGFEIDTPVRMRNGQLVVLKINIAPQKPPVSAITRLAWVQSRKNGFMKQRVGSLLLFMDPQGKEQLMEHAYAGALSNISGGGMGASG